MSAIGTMRGNRTIRHVDAVGIEQGSQPFQRLVSFIHKKKRAVRYATCYSVAYLTARKIYVNLAFQPMNWLATLFDAYGIAQETRQFSVPANELAGYFM